MLSPIRFLHFSVRFCSSTIRQITPKYGFLLEKSPSGGVPLNDVGLLPEVLRSKAYLDDNVLNNCYKILESAPSNNPAMELSKIRFIAVAYYGISEENKRNKLKGLMENVKDVKSKMFQREIDLFRNSMSGTSDFDVRGTLYTNELVQCFFHREMNNKNFKSIKKLVTNHPSFLDLYDKIDGVLRIPNVPKIDILNLFMNYSIAMNPCYIEVDDYTNYMRKVFEFCNVRIQLIDESVMMKELPEAPISKESCEKLKTRIDEIITREKEALLTSNEYHTQLRRLRGIMVKYKTGDGKKVVVVDALNYGGGNDPKEWKPVQRQWKHVIFVTRMNSNKNILKRYGDKAIYVDKLSPDDLIVLRLALEFGPWAKIVTNDMYRDHRDIICKNDEELRNIWNEWMMATVYKHDCDSVEPLRNFNLRIHQSKTHNNQWIVPIVNGKTPLMRTFKYLSIKCG